jgi:hypothetical protein
MIRSQIKKPGMYSRLLRFQLRHCYEPTAAPAISDTGRAQMFAIRLRHVIPGSTRPRGLQTEFFNLASATHELAPRAAGPRPQRKNQFCGGRAGGVGIFPAYISIPSARLTLCPQALKLIGVLRLSSYCWPGVRPFCGRDS